MGDGGGINQFVLGQLAQAFISRTRSEHTGTFFCDSTTAHEFPLTPTDVIFAAVMALKAYSVVDVSHWSFWLRLVTTGQI